MFSDTVRAMMAGISLLLLVTLVWGTTFPILRATSAHLSGLEISSLRFFAAAICMLPMAVRASRLAWRDGIVLGFIALLSYVSQAIGLEFISSNRSAFLTSLNVLMVPFLALSLGGRLKPQVVIAAALACIGIGLMSWGGDSSLVGDGATVFSALTYAIYIVMLSRRSRMQSAGSLAATQTVAMAVIGAVALIASHADRHAFADLAARAQPVVPSILYLGVVATAGMLFLQAVGQQRVSAQQAALIFALEPVFASLFGWWWLHEAMSGRGIGGACLVLLSVIFGEWRFASGGARPQES